MEEVCHLQFVFYLATFINDFMQRWKIFHQICKSQQIQWMAE